MIGQIVALSSAGSTSTQKARTDAIRSCIERGRNVVPIIRMRLRENSSRLIVASTPATWPAQTMRPRDRGGIDIPLCSMAAELDALYEDVAVKFWQSPQHRGGARHLCAKLSGIDRC